MIHIPYVRQMSHSACQKWDPPLLTFQVFKISLIPSLPRISSLEGNTYQPVFPMFREADPRSFWPQGRSVYLLLHETDPCSYVWETDPSVWRSVRRNPLIPPQADLYPLYFARWTPYMTLLCLWGPDAFSEVLHPSSPDSLLEMAVCNLTLSPIQVRGNSQPIFIAPLGTLDCHCVSLKPIFITPLNTWGPHGCRKPPRARLHPK